MPIHTLQCVLFCMHCVFLCIGECNCFIPHHSDPAQRWDALADGRQVVEEAAAAVSLSEVLNLLDVI